MSNETKTPTPRTDAQLKMQGSSTCHNDIDIHFARQLETELTEAKAENEQLRKSFNPDWDQVEVAKESMKEYMVELNRVADENERLRAAMKGQNEPFMQS